MTSFGRHRVSADTPFAGRRGRMDQLVRTAVHSWAHARGDPPRDPPFTAGSLDRVAVQGPRMSDATPHARSQDRWPRGARDWSRVDSI
jgi:hypothetical protein